MIRDYDADVGVGVIGEDFDDCLPRGYRGAERPINGREAAPPLRELADRYEAAAAKLRLLASAAENIESFRIEITDEYVFVAAEETAVGGLVESGLLELNTDMDDWSDDTVIEIAPFLKGRNAS